MAVRKNGRRDSGMGRGWWTGPAREGAEVDARRALGGVAGGLLVAHVDHADGVVQAAVIDVHHVAAAEGEDAVDALLLEGAGHQLSAVDLGHGGTPPRGRWEQDSTER